MSRTIDWSCPYCNHVATITNESYSDSNFIFDNNNKEECDLIVSIKSITCPNPKCREYEITADLYKLDYTTGGPGKKLMNWKLRPQSNAKPFPNYIPEAIRQDYEEACRICALSPKASATLSRRCLQGIIRDYWNISKSRLIDEINELKGKIDQPTWNAIDAVRSIGNIGAHMEKDINIIIDVEPEEAQLLIGLIEILLKDWYVARHNRDQHLQEIITLAQTKKTKTVNA